MFLHYRTVQLFIILMGLSANYLLASTNPLCKMDVNGNTVGVWLYVDEFSNPIIQTSSLASGETVWSTPINLSYEISNNIINNIPILRSNINGDLFLLWTYIDSKTFNFFLAAAILPFGSSEWNVSTISSNEENVNYPDFQITFNERGNVIAMWTATISNEPVIRMASTVVGDKKWNDPYTVSR